MPPRPEIIIINGPPGVGKTTVASLMKARHGGTVCIEGDKLRAFVAERPREHLGAGSTYRAAAALASAYMEMGAPRVVLDYCFLNRRHVDMFVAAATNGGVIHLLTLWAPLHLVRDRETRRPGREPLGDRVAECHQEIESNLDALGWIVDAKSSPETVLERIEQLISSAPNGNVAAPRTAPKVVIRPARASDLSALVELQRRSWLGTFALVVPYELVDWWVRNDRARSLCEQNWSTMLVAIVADQVVGLVQPDRDEINGLWVHPAHQRCGVGSALLRAGEAAIRYTGHERAWLTCSGANQDAARFYRAMGYREVARIVEPLPCGGTGVSLRFERDLV